MTISDHELTDLVRSVIVALDNGGPGNARALVAKLADHVTPHIHVGRTDLSPRETVEWYAGQILDIVSNGHWIAVNSLCPYCQTECVSCKQLAPCRVWCSGWLCDGCNRSREERQRREERARWFIQHAARLRGSDHKVRAFAIEKAVERYIAGEEP